MKSDRRQFIQAAGTAGAALLTLQTASADDTAAPAADRSRPVDRPTFSAMVTITGSSRTAPWAMGAQAWVTLQQYSRDAIWDGQALGSVAQAPRSFSDVCSGCPMALQETLRVDLLSLSQSLAAGERCPDGPVPAVDEDAGIHAPGPDRFGYDAVRACGSLTTATLITGDLPDGGACDATCGDCTVQYSLTGVRR